MRLNPVGISLNTSFYVSGTASIINDTTCLSSMNASGTITLSDNSHKLGYEENKPILNNA